MKQQALDKNPMNTPIGVTTLAVHLKNSIHRLPYRRILFVTESGIFNPRALLAFTLGSAGIFLALITFAASSENSSATPASFGQKIGGIGTGGCSLQEAIYSSVLHNSLDGGAHGIAIDATDPDHFITTECVMGTGNGDTIMLPTGAVFNLDALVFNSLADAHNPYGPTATPIIFSTMTIEGAGATLQWTGGTLKNARLFAIGFAAVTIKQDTLNTTVSGAGALTLRNVYIRGFHAKGGNGTGGGGGGMGAGGAIYLQNGTLTVENSTFDDNGAVGGNGGASGWGTGGDEGGGGGIGGAGGTAHFCTGCGVNPSSSGGGGGGSKGNGGGDDGGGGGTMFSGGSGYPGGAGGYLCGGKGGNNGQDGQCPGGGGGAGQEYICLGGTETCDGNGGNGAYGGGGGGGSGGGGAGGFGGGGGSPRGAFGSGGNGGFGGGGGADGGIGGQFGGAGSEDNGGGGGGLGGAIFNDSGRLTIHNSTFYNNFVTRGLGGSNTRYDGTIFTAPNGGDAGGAIFSHNGLTTIVDSTFSNNQSTGSGGGVVIFSDNPFTPANLVLQDTILANNGANECFYTGNAAVSGVGNLITTNGSGTQPFGTCPGVVTTTDPQLDPNGLKDNGGPTPTLAIPLFSSAMGVADPGTSLLYDQRYADRPQSDSAPRNGYDIGAYTVCRRFFGGRLQSWICSETNAPPPPTTTLTMQASPSYEGTTNPSPGSHTVDLNSVVSVQATPNSGYHFTNWTGNVAQSSNPSTTVTVMQAQTVTANFANGSPSADLHVTVSDGKTAAVAGAKNTYTIVVSNAGPSYVSGGVVKDTFPSIFTGVTFSATQIGGAYGFPVSGSGNINNTVTMPPGSSITYKATGKLSAVATGTVSDSASVTAPSGITDPNLGNNSATDADSITFKADLKVTVTDGKTSAVAGSKNTYTIVVTNAGPSKVNGAVIRDTFPSTFTGVTYTATQSGGASGFTASGSGNINNTVTMPPASKITYKATGTISASATQSISDTATVAAPSGVTDLNTANNSATDTDTL